MPGTGAKTDGQSASVWRLHVAWLPHSLVTSRCLYCLHVHSCYRGQAEAASSSVTHLQSHTASLVQCPPRNKGRGIRLYPIGAVVWSSYRTHGSEILGNVWETPSATDTSKGPVSLGCGRGLSLNSIRTRTRQFAPGMHTGLQHSGSYSLSPAAPRPQDTLGVEERIQN